MVMSAAVTGEEADILTMGSDPAEESSEEEKSDQVTNH